MSRRAATSGASRRRGPSRAAAGRGPEAAEVHRLGGVHPVLEALRARRRVLRCLRVRRGARRPEITEVLCAARDAGVPVREVGAEEIAAACGPGVSSQGVVLEAGPLPELPLDDLLDNVLGRGEEPRTLVALDGVEDPQNLGAIARTAEASGAVGLILTRRRAPPLSPAVARASAGAIEWLPAARVPNLPRALNHMKSHGFWVFGSEPEGAADLFEVPDRMLRGDRVVVLGAEGRGLRRGVDRVLDYRIRVPMAGRVASLNVSAAAAVVLFELRRRSRVAGPG
jgi:23S rRNA (guanosine2251-2'-O)-methyltransferase